MCKEHLLKPAALSFLAIFLFIPAMLNAAVLKVPADYPSIQAAINASSSGDTIMVSPGVYFENINFRGKNIFVTSLFAEESDTSYISSTVINGGNPINPDTASCVIFNSGEDSTAVLQGFTITGGTGTKWLDIHGAGIYREGGGILIELSSPTIRHNVITDNAASNSAGVTSAGGGGIRVGDGNPIIENNVISFNEGRYGAGIVLNYTGGKIRNNVICNNYGGEEFYGGSGIWIYNNLPSTPKVIENNTIVNNDAAASGGTGGILVWSAINVKIRNNILYSNSSVTGLQIKSVSATPQVNYCDVEGGYTTGTGNIDVDPSFADEGYYLKDGSPCIDKGDPEALYNDVEDPGNPGNALFPSRGGLRNDMGAYGGPGASVLPGIQLATGQQEIIHQEINLQVYPNPVSSSAIIVIDQKQTDKSYIFKLFDMNGREVLQSEINGPTGSIFCNHLIKGIYIYKLLSGTQILGQGKLEVQ